jgi:hypothetical protein
MNFEIHCDAVGTIPHSQHCKGRSDSGGKAGVAPADNKLEEIMSPNESRPVDRQHPIEVILDFAYESHYEFVERLAYKLWVQRGRPLGSPDVDWFAAEKAVYTSLVASGTIASPSKDPENISKEIGRWMKSSLETQR